MNGKGETGWNNWPMCSSFQQPEPRLWPVQAENYLPSTGGLMSLLTVMILLSWSNPSSSKKKKAPPVIIVTHDEVILFKKWQQVCRQQTSGKRLFLSFMPKWSITVLLHVRFQWMHPLWGCSWHRMTLCSKFKQPRPLPPADVRERSEACSVRGLPLLVSGRLWTFPFWPLEHREGREVTAFSHQCPVRQGRTYVWRLYVNAD